MDVWKQINRKEQIEGRVYRNCLDRKSSLWSLLLLILSLLLLSFRMRLTYKKSEKWHGKEFQITSEPEFGAYSCITSQ